MLASNKWVRNRVRNWVRNWNRNTNVEDGTRSKNADEHERTGTPTHRNADEHERTGTRTWKTEAGTPTESTVNAEEIDGEAYSSSIKKLKLLCCGFQLREK